MKILDELCPALAVISGGLGDIGWAMAKAFHAAGAQVALADVVDPPANLPHFYKKLDVSDAGAVEQWYESVVAHFDRPPNIIASNAAIVTEKPHLKISAAEWKRELDINLNGAFYFAETGARLLAATGKPGRIIFMGSWVGHAPFAPLPGYCASKAGLQMLCRTMALELAPLGILVNEIAPGYVNAGLTGKILAREPGLEAKRRSEVPIRKLITADEVAAQALYLCGPVSIHTTGSTIFMDGGLSLLRARAS